MTADLDATISSVTCPPPLPLPDLSHLATLQALTGAGCQVFMFQVFSASNGGDGDLSVLSYSLAASIKLANVSLI